MISSNPEYGLCASIRIWADLDKSFERVFFFIVYKTLVVTTQCSSFGNTVSVRGYILCIKKFVQDEHLHFQRNQLCYF